jgi:hypothetical protein
VNGIWEYLPVLCLSSQLLSEYYPFDSSSAPDATLVAGYTTWQKEFGRQVQKGEKAIKIIAPAPTSDWWERIRLIQHKAGFGCTGKSH